MNFKIAILALGLSIIALCISIDAHAKCARGGHRAHDKTHKAQSKNTQAKTHQKVTKDGDTHVHNYGNQGSSSSNSVMPMIAGAAMGYTAANMINDKDSDKGSSKTDDNAKPDVHPQERNND